MNKRYISTSGLPTNAQRRALLGLGMASVLAAAGCGGGGGGGGAPELPSAEVPSPGNPPGAPGAPLVDTRAWQLALEIDQGVTEGVDVGEPVMALDGLRGGMAVWLRTESARTVLMASRYTPAGNWLPPVQIDAAVGGTPSKPRIAMDGLGNAIAVWEQAFGGRANVVYNRYDSVVADWETAKVLQRDFDTSATDPRIAMDVAGNAVAVWCQATVQGSRVGLLSNSYVVDVGWTDVILPVVEVGGVNPSFSPELGIDASGNAHVVWQRAAASGTGNEIWSSVLPAAVEGSVPAWGAVMEVSRHSTAGNSEQPRIAVGADGVAVVVWRRETGAGSRSIRARRYLPGAAQWEPAQTVATKVGDQDDPVPDNPQVAIDRSGHAIAVWDQVSATNGRTIAASRFSPSPAQGAVPWSVPVNLERVRGGLSTVPKVSMDEAGNALVVWGQQDEAGEPIRVLSARYLARNDQWSSSGQRLQVLDAPGGAGVQVAMRAEGTALAIWKQVSKTGNGGTAGAIWSADFK
jgi:hypothetical protein